MECSSETRIQCWDGKTLIPLRVGPTFNFQSVVRKRRASRRARRASAPVWCCAAHFHPRALSPLRFGSQRSKLRSARRARVFDGGCELGRPGASRWTEKSLGRLGLEALASLDILRRRLFLDHGANLVLASPQAWIGDAGLSKDFISRHDDRNARIRLMGEEGRVHIAECRRHVP